MNDEAKAAESATEADLEVLCQSCGLCCDGSLFGRVDLQPEEVESARRRRLRVLPSVKGFEEPCTALASSGPGLVDRRCSIYDERPLSCRRFVCRLYDRYRRKGGLIEEQLAVVRRVRLLVATLESSGLEPTDFDGVESSAQANDVRAAFAADVYLELRRSLEENFARAIITG
jgi:Fe-S-cluster containining protein